MNFTNEGIILVAFILLYIYTWKIRNARMKLIRDIVAKYPDPTLPLRDINVAREVAMVTRQMDFTMIYPLANAFGGFKVTSSPTMAKIIVSTKQRIFPPYK
ncbi:hypothetical protein BGZ76_004819, partial [Entomortierella beljakovae]